MLRVTDKVPCLITTHRLVTSYQPQPPNHTCDFRSMWLSVYCGSLPFYRNCILVMETSKPLSISFIAVIHQCKWCTRGRNCHNALPSFHINVHRGHNLDLLVQLTVNLLVPLMVNLCTLRPPLPFNFCEKVSKSFLMSHVWKILVTFNGVWIRSCSSCVCCNVVYDVDLGL